MQAITPLEEAVKLEPRWAAPRVVLAKVRFDLNLYPQAIQQMEVVLKTPLPFDPKDTADFWTRLGRYRYTEQVKTKPEGSRNFDESVKAFERAVAADKKYHEAYYYLARIAASKGEYSKAADAIKSALDAQPGYPPYKTLQAEILYKQGNIDEASAEVNDVLGKMAGQESSNEYGEAKALATKINEDLSSRRMKKMALIAGPIVLLLVVGGFAFTMMRGKKASSVMLDGDMGGDANSYEEICATALRRLSALTQMAHGAMYITTLDGDEMVPRATLALETDEVKPVVVDINELPRWVERNDGKPFLFKAEKKEGTFIKAFPDAREQMEPLQIRIGVPFIFQERMLGMAFIGIEESKDMLRLKKLYDRSQGDIYRIAVEYAAALYRLYEDELAYVDVLTKFKSRRYVEENLPRALVDAEDAGRKGAIVMFEFDQFRALQEQYGDPQAEAVLKTVAAEVKLAIPPEDGMVARFEGGKFFAFAPVASADEAYKFAERVLQRICDTRISRNFAPPTGSVGLAVFPDHGKKADDLIWAADRVMMGIGAGGGNAIGTADGSAPTPAERAERAEREQASAPAAAPTGDEPATKTGFMPGRPTTEAAPRPFMGGAPPLPAAPSPAAPPPLPTAPGQTKTGFVPGFSGGSVGNEGARGPSGGGLLRGPGSAPPAAPPPPAVPARPSVPGFGGSGAAAPTPPPPPPPLPPKSGGIPGFSGGGGTPPLPGTPPPLPGAPPPLPTAAPSTSPPVGGPPRSGVPGMTPRPPAPPPGGAAPGFATAPKASLGDKSGSSGLTPKSGTGGLTPKASSFPGAAKSSPGKSADGTPPKPTAPPKPTFPGTARPEGKPLFPTAAPAEAAPEPPEASPAVVSAPEATPPAEPVSPPAEAARSPFPGAPPKSPFPGAPAAFPGAPAAFPGAPPRTATPPASAGGSGKIPGFGGGAKPPVDLDAPTVRNPIAGEPKSGGIPGFGGRAKPRVDLDAPTVRGPMMGEPAAAEETPAAPAAPAGRAPIDGPTVPWGKQAAPAAEPAGVPWGAPAPPPATEESTVPWGRPAPPAAADPMDAVRATPTAKSELEDAPGKAAPATPPWLQAEVDKGPAAAPAGGRSGLLGGKGGGAAPPAKPGGGGKLFRRAGDEASEAARSAPASAPSAAVPAAYEISAGERDATGFVGPDVLNAALQREVERTTAMNDACSVLYFQLDRQAEIVGAVGADRLGSIQNEIASLVNDFLKEGTDIPGRWNDGFVIVLPRTPSRIACNLAEQIRFTVSNLSFPGIQGNSTLSIGIAACPEHAAESGALLASARNAATEAESEGGNAIKVFGA